MFAKEKTTEGQSRICSIYEKYELPYLYVCRDKSNCLRQLRQENYEQFFSELGDMVNKYDHSYFLRAMILNIGYSLMDDEWKDDGCHPEFAEWVDSYIEKFNPRQVYATQFRLIAASLNKNPEEASRLHSQFVAELDTSNEDKEYIESKKKDGELLVKAATR